MTLKLIDLDQYDEPEEIQTGTCEMCFGTDYCSYPSLLFKKSDGTNIVVDIYYMMPWTNAVEELYIDNVVNFAAFVAKKKLPDDYFDDTDDQWNKIEELIEEYDDPEGYALNNFIIEEEKNFSNEEYYSLLDAANDEKNKKLLYDMMKAEKEKLKIINKMKEMAKYV